MNLPIFGVHEDPGPNFLELLRRLGASPGFELRASAERAPVELTHGTTILALKYRDGVVMIGDRRATEANRVAYRQMRKVFPVDSHSVVGIAGVAGTAMELVRLFQVQVAHFEKVEGTALSLEGKANQLAQMIRGNFDLAMRGLVVVPIFAGYDLRRLTGRIFSYDVVGGRYEETDFHATGSGGRDARLAIKLGYDPSMEEEAAVRLGLKALLEAADEDTATGGPDVSRGIYPIVAKVTRDGYAELPEDAVRDLVQSLESEVS